MSFGIPVRNGVGLGLRPSTALSTLRVGGRPALSLDFLNTSTLDSRITFSRGSAATLTDSTGKITYAPNNLVTFSEQFDNAAWTKGAAVTIGANAGTAPNGTTTADQITITGTDNGIYQSVTVVPGVAYVQSWYVRLGTLSASDYKFALYNNTAGSFIAADIAPSPTPNSTGWTRITYRFTAPAGCTSVRVYVNRSPSVSAGTLFVWGAQLEAVTYQTTPGIYNSTTPANLLGYTQEFDNAAWAKSVLSVTANTATAPDGTLSADKLIADTTTAVHTIGQNISVVSGTTMTGSVYAKAGEYNFAAVLLLTTFAAPQIVICNLSTGTISSTSGSPIATSITAVGNGWYRISITQVTNATGTATMQVRPSNVGNTTFFTGDGTSGVYIWGAQLSNSASLDPYVYNPGAAPTSTAYYGPRFDYDPVTLAPKGLLIEEQRTNLATYSDQFDNAAWTKTNTTVTANAASSPDGTANADALFETSATGTHTTQRTTITITANATMTGSVFLKPNGRTNFDLRLQGSTGQCIARGSLVGSGSVSAVNSGAGVTSAVSITPYADGWYRVTVSGIVNATDVTEALFIYTRDDTGATSFTGDPAKGFYVYGAQLEAGAFATSYIPTVAATVTRSADVATMTGTNLSSWYNQSEGTIFVSADSVRPAASSPATRVFSFNDGTSSNDIRTGNTSTLQVIEATVVQANLAPSPVIPFDGTPFKFASAWKANNFASVTTGAVSTDASGTVPAVTQFSLGSGPSTTGVLGGHLRSITYYSQRLPNATLQALTA